MPTDRTFTQLKTPAAKALLGIRDQIITAWEAEVIRELKDAAELPRPVLIDTMPKVVENLVEALEVSHPRKNAAESNSLAVEHGGERARLSKYGPDQLLREYQILRDVIFHLLSKAVELTENDRNVIQKSIDASVQEAMLNFFLVHTQLKEQFVAALTHDLRNPLSAAKMSAEIILRTLNKESDSPLKASLVRLAGKILSNTRRVDRMVQDLLDTSLLQTGEKLPLKISECEILAIAREAIADFPEEEQARIIIDGPATQGYWDAGTLVRAIENLVGNAIKYGEEHRPITIQCEPAFGRVQFSIHNEGNPIASKDQAALFEPYHRSPAAKASEKKGWGIGLSLAHGIVQSHSGSLLVDSSPERGTTFTIDIPIDVRPLKSPSI